MKFTEAIDLLPLDLKESSLSNLEVVLPYYDVLRAIDVYSSNKWVVLNWEGWIKYSEGKHGHSMKFNARSKKTKKLNETWESFVKRSADDCKKTIKFAQERWNSEPEYPGAILYYCINAVEKPSSDKEIKEFEEDYSEEVYFAFSATLRIFGNNVPFEEITKILGLVPTHTHRKGESRSITRPDRFYEHDMWLYDAPVHEEEKLDDHIKTLWNSIKRNKEFLLKLKEQLKVDIFLGYRSNSGTAGFEINPDSLEMFIGLNTPFQVSVIIV